MICFESDHWINDDKNVGCIFMSVVMEFKETYNWLRI